MSTTVHENATGYVDVYSLVASTNTECPKKKKRTENTAYASLTDRASIFGRCVYRLMKLSHKYAVVVVVVSFGSFFLFVSLNWPNELPHIEKTKRNSLVTLSILCLCVKYKHKYTVHSVASSLTLLPVSVVRSKCKRS